VQWEDPGLPEKDGNKSTVYEVDFSSDGELLVVACANLVLVYEVKKGDLLHRLKGHKDNVYSVSFIKDGTRFASGGADKTVIIWNNKGDGVLKYMHNDSIQKVSYNQATDQLVSCTANDFGLWSKEQKAVSKLKVTSLTCSSSCFRVAICI
jgi:intraflagellar transport protein 122